MAIGDISDDPGLQAFAELLPELIAEYKPDFIIANGENAAKGLGITPPTFEQILSIGADAVTLGNHTWSKKDVLKIINHERLVRPINYPEGTPGSGCRIVQARNGVKVAVMNALGRESIMSPGRENKVILDCPFRAIDTEIERVKNVADLIIVDFHAESVIEKKSFAYYLDGRVNAIYGTHLHIQTADECILPKGTAYITDLGMTGSFDSVVGIKKEQAVEHYCTQRNVHFTGATEERGISGVVIYLDDAANYAPKKIVRIMRHSKFLKQYNIPFEEINQKYDSIVSHEPKLERYAELYKKLSLETSVASLYATIARGANFFTNGLYSAVFSYSHHEGELWNLKSGFDTCMVSNFNETIQSHLSSLDVKNIAKLTTDVFEIMPGVFVKIFPLADGDIIYGAIALKLNHYKLELDIDEKEMGILQNFITDARDSIKNFSTRYTDTQKLQELQTLYEVSKTISASIELDQLLDNIMAMATKVMNSETSSILMLDEKTNELTFQIAQGDKGEEVKRLIRLKVGQGIAGWVAQTGENCIVPDTSKDPRFYKEGDAKTKFVTKSLICVPLKHKDKIIGVLEVLNRKGDIPFNDHDTELLELLASQCSSPIVNAQLYQNIRNLYKSTLKVLANALDAKDSYTHGHSQRVAEYSLAIAGELGLSPKEKDDLEFAALLHDIGKIGIRDNILCKPGKLTDEEFKIIQMHPVMSAEILAPVDFLTDKIPIVKHHHERFDGRGYPSKLKGEEIPLGARIICVADTFDAMTSNRSYRKGLPAEVALEELKRCSNAQFDPIIVEMFLRVFAKKYATNFEEIRTKFEEQESVLQINPADGGNAPAGAVVLPPPPAAPQQQVGSTASQQDQNQEAPKPASIPPATA